MSEKTSLLRAHIPHVLGDKRDLVKWRLGRIFQGKQWGQLFRDEAIALVCLRDQHGWDVLIKGDHAGYEVKEERGRSFMLMQACGAGIYVQCKWKSLGVFQRVV